MINAHSVLQTLKGKLGSITITQAFGGVPAEAVACQEVLHSKNLQFGANMVYKVQQRKPVSLDQTLAAIKIVLMEAARLQGLSAEKQTQVQPVNLHDEAVKADIVNYQVFTTTRKGEEDLNNVSFWIYVPNGSLRVSFFEQLQRKKKNCHGKQPDNFHGKSDRSVYASHGIPIRVGVYMQVMNSDFSSDPIYASDGIEASQEMLQSTACSLYILWFFHRSRSRKRGEKGAMYYLSWRDAISIPLSDDDA